MRLNDPPRQGAELLAELRALIDSLPQPKRRKVLDSLREFLGNLRGTETQERR